MALQQFTRNYSDHSNDQGFQFEFNCDKCGNGWRSAWQANKLGVAASLLRGLGSLLGGNALAGAARAGDHVKDALRGKAWDDAFAIAIGEGKAKFHQCTRCGKWVCPEVCWNEGRSLCEECAPNLEEEAASAQATAAKEQVWDKARKVDQTDGIDVAKKKHKAACPHCNARLEQGAKFCAECGKPVVAPDAKCGKCGAKIAGKSKFCGECGAPRG